MAKYIEVEQVYRIDFVKVYGNCLSIHNTNEHWQWSAYPTSIQKYIENHSTMPNSNITIDVLHFWLSI